MSFFRLFDRPDMAQGLQEYQTTPGACLLDVRTPQEYREGHIPGSQNLPLDVLDRLEVPQDTPLFVYCHSGARSRHAAAVLGQMGYARVRDLGGITAYKGKVDY